MADAEESNEIKQTDIVFDCPHCGKSLAIDYHGAGLSIPCTDCGQLVQVPIPEGMELSDIDASDEDQEIRILNLRRSLAASEEQVETLEAEVEELRERRRSLEQSRTDSMYRFGLIAEKTGLIENALQDIRAALEAINEALKT